jgi:tetratricopeptide (TPR) repeat protein
MSRHEDSDARMARLADTQAAPGSVEAELALHVAAAESALSRARLAPDAVNRIEAKLDALEADGGRVWLSQRAPIYVLAAAALVFVAWSRLHEAPNAPPKQVAQTASQHLDSGTLAVATDEAALSVETPAARVEVAPHSRVRITVFGSDVRIAATSGSARVIYYDGRIELVQPSAPVIETPSQPSAEAPAKPIALPLAHGPVAPHAHVHVAASSTPARAVASAPVAVAPLDPEHQSFNAVVARVRPAPAEALTLLDAHLQRYPTGALRADAERLRVAVLLRLQRKSDALAALDHMSSPVPELRIVRAELRAEMGRAEEAIADFGAVLVSDDDRFAERALFGRAMAREKMADRARATEDLERCLLLYPQGELAERARIELRRVTSEAAR